MKHLTIAPLFILAFANIAWGQDPVVYGQLRMSVDNASNSGDETTGSASSNGLEFIGGFNDYRTDGTIKASFGVTSDGGQTWSQVLVRPPAQYQTTVEGDPMSCYDPRTGTLFAGAIAFGGNGGVYLAKKNPGQNSFGTAVMCRVSGGADKEWVTAGPIPGNPNTTRLYIAYNEGVIRSDDLGATWTSPFSLGTGLGFLPRVGPNGEAYVTYWDTGYGIKFRKSLNGGVSWSSAITAASRLATWGVQSLYIPGNFRNPPIHTMAVNPVTGDLVIVWFDLTNTIGSNGNLDLYLIRSTDQGTTWTTPARLPFRPLNTVGDMIFPWVEFTKEGRLNLLAFDSSYTANQTDGVAHGFWDQIYVYSDDEGATWSQKFRLTPNSFDSYYDGRNTGFSFLGDYNGMGAASKWVFPVYCDTHTNQAEIYTNKVWDPIEPASSFSLFRGRLVSGITSDLFLRDGKAVVAKQGIVANSSEAPIQLDTTVTGIVNTSPSALKVQLWTMVNTVNIQQTVLMFNVNTNAWDTVDTRTAPTSATNTLVNVANPADYITPGSGTAKCRVMFKAVGPVTISDWAATLDQDVLLDYP